ncbi:MAG: hypothetical protein LC753_05245 [Acidobacteria bacterium]|nr:hypothetical protein [Acidobacteriota bacterium]
MSRIIDALGNIQHNEYDKRGAVTLVRFFELRLKTILVMARALALTCRGHHELVLENLAPASNCAR